MKCELNIGGDYWSIYLFVSLSKLRKLGSSVELYIGDHRKKSSSRENERGKNLPETSRLDDLETREQNLPDVDDLEREGQSARGSFMDFGNSEQIRTKSSKTHGQTGPPAPKRVSPGHNSAMCPEKKMHNFFDANRFLLL